MPYMKTDEKIGRIGVIGGGIAGIAASYLLSKKYHVTILESAHRIGGHTNTIEVEASSGTRVPVDTGFIVLNDCNYGVLHTLFNQWGVEVRWSDMSFSYYDRANDYYYAGTDIFGLFPKIEMVFSSLHWSLLREIMRFGRVGLSFLKEREIQDVLSLDAFLKTNSFSENFIQNYLLPMGSAIWSVPLDQIRSFPARSFLTFFRNHGLLSFTERPRWQTVVGGSYAYVEKFKKIFTGSIISDFSVARVFRNQDSVRVVSGAGDEIEFDEVVFACHADDVLRILDAPTPQEHEVFSSWRYQPNIAILHTDDSVMPPKKVSWASWNYHTRSADSDATLTYYMNKLQGIRSSIDYFVTLNDDQLISQDKVIKKIEYMHPVYDAAAIVSQKKMHEIQAKNRTYFCGSYMGYGFHEDAARSGAQIGLYKGLPL